MTINILTDTFYVLIQQNTDPLKSPYQRKVKTRYANNLRDYYFSAIRRY